MSWVKEYDKVDFVATSPTGAPVGVALERDIIAAGLATELQHQSVPGRSTRWSNNSPGVEKYEIKFVSEPSAGDLTTLDGVVSAHDGLNIPTIGPHHAKSDDESQTNDDNYVIKISQSFNVRGGLYRVGVCGLVGTTGSNQKSQARFVVDSVTVSEIPTKPADADNTESWCSFDYVTLSAGSCLFEVEFKNVGNGSATIKEVRIEAIKVSN